MLFCYIIWIVTGKIRSVNNGNNEITVITHIQSMFKMYR